MKKYGRCTFLMSFFIITATAFGDARLNLFLQPIIAVDQEGSLYQNGKMKAGLHRAKVGLSMGKKYDLMEVSGVLSADFAEDTYSNLVENSYCTMAVNPRLNFKAGKFKVPFGAHNLIPSSNLPTVYRSFTVEHLKKELCVAGYQSGVAWSGTFFDKIDATAGFFKYPAAQRNGMRFSDLYQLPVARVATRCWKNVTLGYMAAAPEMGNAKNDGAKALRLFLHDFSVTVTNPSWYEGFLEVFYGVDTARVSTLNWIFDEYRNNIAYSIYTSHSFSFKVPNHCTGKLTSAVEFVNGLNYYYYHYVNRPFNYVFTQCAQLHLNKDLCIDLSYDTRYDYRFHSIHHQRVALQCTWKNAFRMGAAKKEKDGKTGDSSKSDEVIE